MIAVLTRTCIRALNVITEGIVGAIIMFGTCALVKVSYRNTRYSNVRTQRQFRIFDGRFQKVLEVLFGIEIVAIFCQMYQNLNGDILIACEVLFSAVECVAFSVITNPNGCDLRSVVEFLKIGIGLQLSCCYDGKQINRVCKLK